MLANYLDVPQMNEHIARLSRMKDHSGARYRVYKASGRITRPWRDVDASCAKH